MKRIANPQSGAALPFVLIILALNVVVIVAMLAYATTEYQASRNSVQAESARVLAQSGIDLAAGLISANSTNNAFVTYQRVPQDANGAYRLETKIGNAVAADPNKPWKKTAANPVVLHSGFTTSTNGFDLNYAADSSGDAGFIAPRRNFAGWTNLSTNMFLMDWIYVYNGPANNISNLVGRIAYWVDDESSKLNLNYSGNKTAYSSNWTGNTFWENFTVKRPSGAESRNLDPTKWPSFLDLGGVAGITDDQSQTILRWRGDPLHGTNTNSLGVPITTNFPSALAVRIATNSVLTTLAKQSELGFTATVYSREAERTYATGRKRMDMMEVISGAPMQATLDGIVATIKNNYEKFDNKYDLTGFASSLYSFVQKPSAGVTNFGESRLYSRALPIINEIGLKAYVTAVTTNVTNNNNGLVSTITNTNFAIACSAEFISLSVIKSAQTHELSWAGYLTNPSKFHVDVQLPANARLGIPLPVNTKATNTNAISLQGSSSNWFPYGGLAGPSNSSLTGALTTITKEVTTNMFNPVPVALQWVLPTNITVNVYYGTNSQNISNVGYQSFSFQLPTNLVAPTFNPPAVGQTNILFQAVGQPQRSSGYRGDPRFAKFEGSAAVDKADPVASLGSLNPNWDVAGYAAEANEPDLTPPDQFFASVERGLPQHVADKLDGIGATLAGVGWLGIIPITTKSGDALAWSTPRFWGNGRPNINNTEYPPDWLLMDCFHFAAFQPLPEYTGSANMIYSAFGRINVNSAKSVFQVALGSSNRSDTIMHSLTRYTRTVDFQLPSLVATHGFSYGGFRSLPSGVTNVRFLNRVQEMVTNRGISDNPYTTPFEFLADLSATNIPGSPTNSSTDWWVAPYPGIGNSATNTTDRRAESIVRGLVHKLTTHGNQFTIFSVGQVLQPSSNGTVNISNVGKANIVGETYLQAVYERAPLYNDSANDTNVSFSTGTVSFPPGAIINSPTGAPPMRQLFLRELR